jgi:large subunit ribosomal protein L14e
VLVNFGPLAGKLAVIVDIVNTSRILIHGPKTGVRRQEISIQRVSLTDFKLDIHRGIHRDALIKAIESSKFEENWAATGWARLISKRIKRAQLTDFDRFKVKVLKQKRTVEKNKALKAKNAK